MNVTATSVQTGKQVAKYFWSFLSVIIAAVWLAVVYWVHSAVGGVGTGLLFSIMAYVVGAPGVIGIGLVCTIIVMFSLMINSIEAEEMDVKFILWCLTCWIASIVLGVVWPIVVVLNGVAQMVSA